MHVCKLPLSKDYLFNVLIRHFYYHIAQLFVDKIIIVLILFNLTVIPKHTCNWYKIGWMDIICRIKCMIQDIGKDRIVLSTFTNDSSTVYVDY